MKLQLSGSFKDHNATLVTYKLVRDDSGPGWHCLIDPHGQDQWNAAGFGYNHAEAVKSARVWWQQYDEAE